MRLKLIDPINSPEWDQFVHSFKSSSFYHLSDWAKVLQLTFGYQPVYIILEDNVGIKAGLPLMQIDSWLTGKRFVSLPRTPYCDSLTRSEEDLEALVNHAIELVEKNGYDYLELKIQSKAELLQNLSFKRYRFFKNHIISLTNNMDELWKSFHRSCTRQRIAKAQKTGIKVRNGQNKEDLKIFYSLYKKSINKHKIPGRPFSFFENILNIFKMDKIIILIAELGNIPIAANLSFKYRDTWYYEFVGYDYNYMQYSAGHLLIWEAINIAYLSKLKFFDLGLTPIENNGLSQFKKRWNAEEKDLFYYYYPDVKGYKTSLIQTKMNNSELHFIKNIKSEIKVHAARLLSNEFG